MKISFTVPFRRVAPRDLSVAPSTEPQGRAPHIARLLALAHKLDAMVGTGEMGDYGQLARLGHISPARLTQIMVLLHLGPAIQEYIFFLRPTPDSSPSSGCARSLASLGGTGNANFSSNFFRLACMARRRDECHHAATAAKRKTDKMTTSQKKNKNESATTKARVAKWSVKTAPLKAEPVARAESMKKHANAANGGSKTDKILNLLKRPSGVTLNELVKLTGWRPNSVRGFLSGAIGKKMGRRWNPLEAATEIAPTAPLPNSRHTAMPPGHDARRRFLYSSFFQVFTPSSRRGTCQPLLGAGLNPVGGRSSTWIWIAKRPPSEPTEAIAYAFPPTP